MIKAINSRYSTLNLIDGDRRAEVRLACLLHDCGHGPFSHASEVLYGSESYEIPLLKNEQKSLFGRANPHEILGYCIVTSKKFRELWDDIKNLYDLKKDKLICNLDNIDLERIGAMILGMKAKDRPLYLSQFVNGPFDADKFDYIIRDGYFSGLVTSIDIERLFVSLDAVPYKEHQRKEIPEDVLCTDIGGATVLEQVLFNKMLLTSSFYHHHKIRAAFRTFAHLLSLLKELGLTLNNIKLDEAPKFLLLEDPNVFCIQGDTYPKEVVELADNIKHRKLPRRALVITKESLMDDASRTEYFRLLDNPALRTSMELEIAKKSGTKAPVFIDLPDEPKFLITGQHSLIRQASRSYITLDDLYPAAGWVAGYAEYRYKAYVFAPLGLEERVRDTALDVFSEHAIKLDRFKSSELAKLPISK
jgi:HD superfamily phosphohydrolase